MPAVPTKRWKSWLKKSKRSIKLSNAKGSADSVEAEVTVNKQHDPSSPVTNYYRHRIKNHLNAFYNFALQTQSLTIREAFSKYATNGRYNLVELLAAVEAQGQHGIDRSEVDDFADGFDQEVLLVLAALLFNTARNDLDIHASVQIYDFVYAVYGEEPFAQHQRLQYIEALVEASRYDDLERRVDQLGVRAFAPLQVDLLKLQRMVPFFSSEGAWLAALNEVYDSLGMSNIHLSDDEALPLMDRLQSRANSRIDGPKVSVIMPTYSPGPGIRTAIRSLLEQTWQNLEIIIVDDASPDEFEAIFGELAALDSRISVIKQERNAGAYVARNTGLATATGKYVTTHDDDDWSHPDKIASQVSVLTQDETVAATVSAHIRASQDMVFQRVNKRPVYTQLNYSSLMFRKSLAGEIGDWDTVTRSGDTEFLMRVIANFGSSSIVEISDKPVAFSRVWTGSLTSGEMWRGFYSPSRLLYRGAFWQWQRQRAKTEGKVVLDRHAPRQFPMPTTFGPGQGKKDLGLFDVIYVTDYLKQAKFADVVMREINSLAEQGFRVGYMHLFSPESKKTVGFFPPELFDLQLAGKVTQVSHDNIAETKLLIVYDAAIGMFLDKTQSTVSCHRGILIKHEPSTLSGAEERSPVLLGEVLHHLDNCFGTRFEVVGASRIAQERIRCQIPTRRILPDRLIWNMYLNEGAGEVSAPEGMPRVGFHSYGNQYRWPSTRSTFEDAYVSSAFETRLYGNVEPAKRKFGQETLDSVDVIRSTARDEVDFLESIDFWVYFPHNRLRDQPWRPVLSAMQAGKVVILPTHLETIYGSAAVYAKPNEVSDVVSRLSKETEAYLDQAQRAQDFISSSYTAEQFRNRVSSLMPSTDSV